MELRGRGGGGKAALALAAAVGVFVLNPGVLGVVAERGVRGAEWSRDPGVGIRRVRDEWLDAEDGGRTKLDA